MTSLRTGERSRPKNGPAAGALGLAIVGLVACWSVLGGIGCGVVAIILGVAGRRRAVRGEADNGEIATAAIALGTLAVALSLIFVAIWSYAWHDVGGTQYLDCAVRAGNDQRAIDGCTTRWLDEVQQKLGVSARGSA